ncbi:hypothetical protein V495_00958 [Pseudogymnoascus sp. VKM F-4514 (FW-929)]|nr:hypothetical protein V495_00958 [Pseudogymnoascus sp. VKM F-4514 (FW-929)]KFY58275.1 hypothetical protein V497_04933 [Pseudogymnoascus sp. VKM F-4516 (FW-969)]
MPFWKKKAPSNLTPHILNSAPDAHPPPDPLDQSRWGLFILANQPSSHAHAIDIVALHGLNGDYQRTWTRTLPSGAKVNWLQDLLPTQIPHARILSYGYNSAVQFSQSAASISAFADSFLEELLTWRRSAAEETRPIIFICHSLGGIVVKEALNRAHECERFQKLRDAVTAIAFFGTPHRGADLARWGTMVAGMLRAASLGLSTNVRVVRELQARSEVLRGISRRFVERGRELRILSFWETEQLAWVGAKVVEEDSATLDWPNETAIPVEGDHRTGDVAKIGSTEAEKIILSALYTSDYESHRRRNPKPVPGTCIWFLKNDKYQQWRQQLASGLLWVTADPGCGKSVLSSFLIDISESAESASEVNVCYFFFKDDSAEQRTANYALQALLHQIYTKQPELVKHLTAYHASKGPAVPQQFSSLWKLFLDTTSDQASLNTICIIDGLDECDKASRREFTTTLADYFKGKIDEKNSHPSLKILITSRPDNAIKNSFSTIANIRLRGEDETEAISEDVERVVQANINELNGLGLPVELLTGLQDKLIRGADRTFLWTTLTIDLLKNASEAGASKEDLDAIIESRDIDAIYARLLDVQPRDLRPAAFRMLQIVIAASRPLTLQEMSIVMELKGNQRRFEDVQKSIKHPFENYVKSLCGHFLRIIHSKIYLVHQTARTFLLDLTYYRNLSRPDYLNQNPSTSVAINGVPLAKERIDGANKAHLAVEYLQESLAGLNSNPNLVTTPRTLGSDSFSWRASIRLDQSQYTMLIFCIKYLMLVRRELEAMESSHTQHQHPTAAAADFADLGFLGYAARYWIEHRRQVGTRDMLVTEILLYESMCNPELAEFTVWTAYHPSYVLNFPANPVFIRNNAAVSRQLSQEEILRFFAIDIDSMNSDQRGEEAAVRIEEEGEEWAGELRRQWEEDVEKGEDGSGNNTPALLLNGTSVVPDRFANYRDVRRREKGGDSLVVSMSHVPRGHSFPETRGVRGEIKLDLR